MERPSAETRRHSFRLIREAISGLGWRYRVYATGFILMSLVFILPPLLLEQFKPLPRDNAFHQGLVNWVAWTGRSFDAGKPHHAWVSPIPK